MKILIQIPIGSEIVSESLTWSPYQTKEDQIDQINPEIFKFLSYVNFLKDFHYKTLRDFLCFQIALTQSIFELEKCTFF